MSNKVSDCEQKLMIAVWMMALHDINQAYLLENNVFQFDEFSERGLEIIDNFWDSYRWITEMSGTFPLVAAIFDMTEEDLQEKTLNVVVQSASKINHRSKLTNQYIYATVSRFRDYDKAFEERTKLQKSSN